MLLRQLWLYQGDYPILPSKRITPDSGSAAASSYTEQRAGPDTRVAPGGLEMQTHGFYPTTTEPDLAF